MSLSFYRAFEDRHRGSRGLIKSRLEVYLPFIAPLQSLYARCAALDVGCGRGEWLEILLENGFDARGVDLDAGMLQVCKQLDLPAEYGDAIAALKALEAESLTVVSGFHIVEHIPFESLQQLVAQAMRVLKPAGLLILETPNAENLTVGSHSFYMDPTHNKPIPSLLLSFVTEHAGFTRNKILGLQESQQVVQAAEPSLFDVLHGPSPDYAVIAQKAGAAWQMVLFDAVFAKDYGLSLEYLAWRYHSVQHRHFASLGEQITRVYKHQQYQQELIDAHHDEAQRTAATVQAQIKDVAQQLQQAQAESQARAEQLHGLLHSKSWRLTQPLRTAAKGLRYWQPKVKAGVKKTMKWPLQKSMHFVLARPKLRTKINYALQKHPRLYSRLIHFARNQRIIPGAGPLQPMPERFKGSAHSTLTPHAQHIYSDLKAALKPKQQPQQKPQNPHSNQD